MPTHNAAPEGSLGGDPRSSENNTGNALSLPDTLPAVILERLAAEGLMTCAQWRALGRARYRIWGVTRRHVAQIDQAVRP